MTVVTLAYRLTLYAPRSVDPTEATILTPPGGAAHSDQFKVTTLDNLAGWKPYLGFPKGRTGRVDMLSRATDVGTMSFDIDDVALTPGVNAIRWMTTFLGNAQGDPQLGGLKCYAEESTDGGTTWTAFWTGYVKALTLSKRGRYTLTVRDMMQELTKLPLFKNPPHASVSYAARPLLMPVGLTGASYGVVAPSTDLSATVVSPVVIGGSTLANVAQVRLATNMSAGKTDNFMTSELVSAVAPNIMGTGSMFAAVAGMLPNFSGVARAHLTWNAGANQGDLKVGFMYSFRDDKGHHALTTFYIKPLDDTTDLGYSALPANATAVTFHITSDYKTLGVSLFIDVANALTLLQDILAGKFSQLYRSPDALVGGKVYGDVRRSFANTISSASVPDLPPARFRIDAGEDNALKWIQENILKPYGLALVCDGAGSFSVIDLRLPQSLAGLVTVVDADVVPGTAPKWDFDRDTAIYRTEGTIWEDLPIVDRSRAGGITAEWPSIKELLLKPIDHPVIGLAFGSGDFGEKVWQMGGSGYRVTAGDAAVAGGVDRAVYLDRVMRAQMNLIRRPFAFGSTTTVLALRRTATTNGLAQGQVVRVQVSTLPNPATGQRSGERVCRIIELTRNALELDCRLQDIGVAVVATAPGLTSLALGSDPRHTATITVTLSGTDPAEVRYAMTASGAGAAPADNDLAWHSYPLNLVRATGSITLTELTPGLKLWVQARTFCDDRANLKLPSAWTTSTGLVMTAYATPSVVSITGITATTAKVSWTNGTLDLIVEVGLRSPDSGAYTRIATLLPGSNFYSLWGLVASTAYGVQINYRSLTGILSGVATGSFSTTSTLIVLPLPPPIRRVLL